MAMCIITVNLKAIFRHLDATLPKYQVRCASEAKMPLVSCALSLKGATQMHYLVQFSCTACSATLAETKGEHAQHKVSTHLDYSPRNSNQSHDKFEAKTLTALLGTCRGSDCRSLGWSLGGFEATL